MHRVCSLSWGSALLVAASAFCQQSAPPPAAAPALDAGRDLAQIMASGKLYHLGVPYANFVTGSGDGLDVDLVKEFCDWIGRTNDTHLEDVPVETDWPRLIPDLIGKELKVAGNGVTFTGDCPVRGDLIASGLTVLPWRRQALDFSAPTFPTQIWLLARADSALAPITPSGEITRDIQTVRGLLKPYAIMCKPNTCLDPSLYKLQEVVGEVKRFDGSLNYLAPAIINGEAEATLLDVPDALVALRKWPGKVKIIGPLSDRQTMALGFRRTSPALRAAFTTFFTEFKRSGKYVALVRKYYPTVFEHYADFFVEQGCNEPK